MSKKRRNYTREFKQEALQLWETSGKSAQQIEANLGITHGLLYKWRGDEWSERIDSLINDTPYGKKRNLTGFAGFVDFFNEYVSITNAVYDELEIDSISIDVTKREWPKVEKLTYEFLQI